MSDSTAYYNTNAKPGSIAAKANMVKEYNEKNDFRNVKNKKNMVNDIADLDAQEEEDIQDSYIGQVILECNICHSLIYKKPEEIEQGESEDVVNEADECPFCMGMDGYKIIGQVCDYNPDAEFDSDELDVEEVEEPEEGDETGEGAEEEPEEEPVEEGYRYHSPKKAIIDWLFERRQGLGSAMRYCGVEDLEDAKEEDLNNWLIDNRDLYKEFQDWMKGNLYEESLKEDLVSAEITTDTDSFVVNTDENGGVTISTASTEAEEEPEMVAPIDAEMEAEIDAGIEDNAEEEAPIEEPIEEPAPEEEIPEEPASEEAGEEEDVNIEDFDEEEFDNEFGESLKSRFSNVKSYITESIENRDGKLFIEGVITFNSGSKKATHFELRPKTITNEGVVKFLARNKELKETYMVAGKVHEKKLITESMKIVKKKGATK